MPTEIAISHVVAVDDILQVLNAMLHDDAIEEIQISVVFKRQRCRNFLLDFFTRVTSELPKWWIAMHKLDMPRW